MSNKSGLPVFTLIAEAFGFCYRNLRGLVKQSAVAFLILSAIVVLFCFEPLGLVELNGSRNIWSGIFFEVLMSISLIPFITGWYRRIILSEQYDFKIEYSMRWPEVRYLIYLGPILISYYITQLSFIHLVSFARDSGGIEITGSNDSLKLLALFTFMLFSAVVFLILCVKFVLVFPAAAIDAQAGYKDSWRATKNRFGDIFLLVFMVTVIFVIVNFLYSMLFSIFIPTLAITLDLHILTIHVVYYILFFPIWIFLTAVSTTIASNIYIFVTEEDESHFA